MRGRNDMRNKGHFYIKLSDKPAAYKKEFNKSYFRKALVDNNVKVYLRDKDNNGFTVNEFVGNLIFVDTNNDMYVAETDNEDMYNKTYIVYQLVEESNLVFETPKKFYNLSVINDIGGLN